MNEPVGAFEIMLEGLKPNEFIALPLLAEYDHKDQPTRFKPAIVQCYFDYNRVRDFPVRERLVDQVLIQNYVGEG